MANYPELSITTLAIERIAASKTHPRGLKLLTVLAENSSFLSLGYAQKSRILEEAVIHGDGTSTAAANLPLHAEARFLLIGDDTINWAEQQTQSFNPENAAAWNYGRFIAAIAKHKLPRHSCYPKPSLQTICLSGVVVTEYDLYGSAPVSGFWRVESLWVSADSIMPVSETHMDKNQPVQKKTVEGQPLLDLRQTALQFMKEKFAPQITGAPKMIAKPRLPRPDGRKGGDLIKGSFGDPNKPPDPRNDPINKMVREFVRSAGARS